MPLLPTHKILPDRNSNGHPANVISIITVAGLSSNTVQSAIEEINIKANAAFEKANNITIDPSIANTANLALITANGAYNKANSITFISLPDTPDTFTSNGDYLVAVNSTGTGLSFIDTIDVSETIFTSQIAPVTVANDSVAIYATSSGVSPNKEVALKVKNELGEEIIIASILV